MAVSFFWRCESGTLDGTNDFSAGDTTATDVSGSPNYTTNANLLSLGTNGLDVNSFSDRVRFSIASEDLADNAVGCVGFLMRINTWGAGCGLVRLEGTNSNDNLDISCIGTSELRMRIRSTDTGGDVWDLDTTAAGLTTGVTYFVVGRWNATTDNRSLEIYNTSTGNLITNGQVTSTAAFVAPLDLTKFDVGDVSGNDLRAYIKNVMLSKTYDEPLEDNFSITSYTGYGGGGAVPTITNAGDELFYDGEQVTITCTNAGATQGTGGVTLSPTDNVNDGSSTPQTINSWGDTSITITVYKGSRAFLTNLYMFVTRDGGGSNTNGYVVQIEPRVFVRETLVGLTGTPAASQSALNAFVWRSLPAGAPDQILSSLTTNGSGVTAWQINRGSLVSGDPIWLAVFKDGSPAKATMRKITPSYE